MNSIAGEFGDKMVGEGLRGGNPEGEEEEEEEGPYGERWDGDRGGWG